MSLLLEEVGKAAVPPCVSQKNVAWLQVMTDIDPRYGGMSAAIPELSRTLYASGVDAPIAALCDPQEHFFPEHISSNSISFLPRGRFAWGPKSSASMSLQSLAGQCDGVHVHGLWTPATHAASHAARRANKPLCVCAHGMLEPWSLQQHRIRKLIYAAIVEHRILRGAACLHALTRAEAESYRRITRDVPVVVIPNGVSVPEHCSAKPFLDAHPELQRKRIVLFLSRLHPKKGLDVLLRAWPAIQDRNCDAHLVVAGAGAAGYESGLRRWAAQHCSADSLTFTGQLQGQIKWSALRAAECFVLPSHSEGFSIAILEALGVGTPVIATRACNFPELETADCGWLTTPYGPALQETLNQVLDRPSTANLQMGQRGCTLIRQNYTWTAVGKKMAEVYRWLAGGPMPGDVEVVQ